MSANQFSLLRLKVVAEADAGALMRVLERFHNLGVLPRRVIAEFTTADSLCIQVDVRASKRAACRSSPRSSAQIPCVSQAYWHYC